MSTVPSAALVTHLGTAYIRGAKSPVSFPGTSCPQVGLPQEDVSASADHMSHASSPGSLLLSFPAWLRASNCQLSMTMVTALQDLIQPDMEMIYAQSRLTA